MNGKSNVLRKQYSLRNLRSLCPNSCLCQEICPEGEFAQGSVTVLHKVSILIIRNLGAISMGV